MVYTSNDCYGCATDAYPCIGNACPMRHAKHYICDECNSEVDEGELYYYEGEELCLDCIKERLEVVE